MKEKKVVSIKNYGQIVRRAMNSQKNHIACFRKNNIHKNEVVGDSSSPCRELLLLTYNLNQQILDILYTEKQKSAGNKKGYF